MVDDAARLIRVVGRRLDRFGGTTCFAVAAALPDDDIGN